MLREMIEQLCALLMPFDHLGDKRRVGHIRQILIHQLQEIGMTLDGAAQPLLVLRFDRLDLTILLGPLVLLTLLYLALRERRGDLLAIPGVAIVERDVVALALLLVLAPDRFFRGDDRLRLLSLLGVVGVTLTTDLFKAGFF